jgi:protein-S-isoprenylcysteine O-methyltransferase Ste14
MSNKSQQFPTALSRAAVVTLYMCLLMGVFFLSAGSFQHPFAWLYGGLGLGNVLFLALLLWQADGLLSERSRTASNAKQWDRWLLRLQGILTIAGMTASGLDLRFNWLPVLPLWLRWVGTGILILGNIITGWSMRTNTFFSTHVRIQNERGHRVIDSGPYALVRHPGYLGIILTNLATGLMLGSWLGVGAALLILLLYLFRTAREDQTLQRELPGYADYALRTRYRLMPGIW